MNKLTLVLLALTLSFGLACDVEQEVGNTDAGGQTQNNNNTNNNTSQSGAICSASTPCPNNQFCWNGLCAYGCTENANCANDQYCDTEGDRLCHNKVVTTCPETACASSQVCVNGFCSTPAPDTQCMPSADGNDGCEKNALCIETEQETTACHSFPACPEDKVCPTGTQGAVCNDGIIPNKSLICLTGLCRDVSNCPSQWSCVKGNPSDVIGYCGNGSFGSPCSDPMHCIQGTTCVQPFPGYIGYCQ